MADGFRPHQKGLLGFKQTGIIHARYLPISVNTTLFSAIN